MKYGFRSALILCIVLLPLVVTSVLMYQGEWFYFDHSMYVLLGKALTQGGTLYIDTWDHHPPGMYALIGVISSIFTAHQLALLILNSLLFGILFYIYNLFTKALRIDAYKLSGAVIFSVLSTVFLFAIWNTEQFYAPILAGVALYCFLYISGKKVNFFRVQNLILFSVISGLLLLIKVQAWIEIVGLILLTGLLLEKRISLSLIRFGLLLVLYSIIPLAIWMTVYGAGLGHNFDSIVLYNFAYIDSPSESSGSKSALISIIKVVGLLGVLVWVFWKAIAGSVIRYQGSWLLGWFAISLFASTLSGRLYPHYFIQFIVPITLLFLFVYEFYRRKLRYGEYWIGVIVGVSLICFALFSQVNQTTVTEGGRLQKNIGVVLETMWQVEIPYKDRLACRAFDSAYYCTDAIYELRKRVSQNTKMIVISKEDPAYYIDLNTTPAIPYFSDIHAKAQKSQPWQSYLKNTDYLVIEQESSRYSEALDYAQKNCEYLWNNEKVYLYDCRK